ncbi:hypothetical protein RDI58_022699 [Solanum bulbocastanum]|uniref:Uncharacterized protein n=1 Tax=Solanum bulbocastanum TaxID=147425 RepID=A0AAN8T2J8_SOLBU
MHQGGDEDTRIELTVKLKDKLETKDIEDGVIQSEDATIIDHVQTLHEMVSHQGAVELQHRGNKNNVVIEEIEEKELLQIENWVFKEVGILHS